MWLAFGLTFGLLMVLACVEGIARRAPANYILLGAFVCNQPGYLARSGIYLRIRFVFPIWMRITNAQGALGITSFIVYDVCRAFQVTRDIWYVQTVCEAYLVAVCTSYYNVNQVWS
jgi:hypothetical protein